MGPPDGVCHELRLFSQHQHQKPLHPWYSKPIEHVTLYSANQAAVRGMSPLGLHTSATIAGWVLPIQSCLLVCELPAIVRWVE